MKGSLFSLFEITKQCILLSSSTSKIIICYNYQIQISMEDTFEKDASIAGVLSRSSSLSLTQVKHNIIH